MSEEPQVGVYEGQPFKDYCQLDAVNNSSLSHTERSPRHYRDRQPLPDSDAFRVGRYIHAGKLEPETLAERYVVIPDFAEQVRKDDGSRFTNPRASKPFKELVAAFKENNAGKEFLSLDEYTELLAIVGAINENARARFYFGGTARFETSIVWRDADTGLLCKGRMDCWQMGAGRITDLKTTRDASRFAKAIDQYKYHRQAAFYLDGLAALGYPADEFCIVAVEKDPPYGVRAAPLSDEAISEGRRIYKEALAKIAKAERTNNWPCYDDPARWELPARGTGTKDLTLYLKGEVVTL